MRSVETIVLLLALLTATARAGIAPERLQFEQRLGAMLPLESQFRDEEGRGLALRTYLGSRPVIIVLTYFECPNLCGTVLSTLTTRLRRIDLSVGTDFEVVVASIDPNETPALAARKRLAYAQLYERPQALRGWHFLTSDDANIRALADAIGFHYARDQRSPQFLHPAGVAIVTPEGRIARYLLGVDFPEESLKYGLIEAASGRIGSPADRIWLLCHRYDGASGRYGLLVNSAVRASGVLTLLMLGGAIALWLRQERNRGRHGP